MAVHTLAVSEDGIFVTADIINSDCHVTNTCPNVPEPSNFGLIGLGLAAITLFSAGLAGRHDPLAR